MMSMKTTNDFLPPQTNAGGGGGGRGALKEWELRPGGMLVQKRTDAEQNRAPPPTIRVRVKYGSIYHEIHISSEATFGDLKKMLTAATGLHHEDQKVLYKDRERDSKAFLDSAGVKDKSKLVLQEDPISQEKRYLEMRKNAQIEKAAKIVSQISLEIDRLGAQVSALESAISGGSKVDEKDVVSLVEKLMNQMLKLDGITADGDVKLQRKLQVRRVQKYVEALDLMKMKNPPLQQRDSSGVVPSLIDSPTLGEQPSRGRDSASSVVITTQWETFDNMPTTAKPSAPSTSTGQPNFTWDLL